MMFNDNVLLSFQIEDAMLMFDKQTNRHRGMNASSFFPFPSLPFPTYLAVCWVEHYCVLWWFVVNAIFSGRL